MRDASAGINIRWRGSGREAESRLPGGGFLRHAALFFRLKFGLQPDFWPDFSRYADIVQVEVQAIAVVLAGFL